MYRYKTNTTRSNKARVNGEATRPGIELPIAPRTNSPVPWLTSLHATNGRGNYGSSSFRGNCSGLLIRDLLRYFKPQRVLDPMAGSGTCADVCQELGIDCASFDLRNGFDATDPQAYRNLGQFDFVWMHPPYWNMIRYGSDPRCLGNAPTLKEWDIRVRRTIANCRNVLAEQGKLAVLIGDGKSNGRYMALPFRVMYMASSEGLWPACPEIVRFSHNAASSRKRYRRSFIPRMHDLCLVLQRKQRQSNGTHALQPN